MFHLRSENQTSDVLNPESRLLFLLEWDLRVDGFYCFAFWRQCLAKYDSYYELSTRQDLESPRRWISGHVCEGGSRLG